MQTFLRAELADVVGAEDVSREAISLVQLSLFEVGSEYTNLLPLANLIYV